ncbi:hypothetical protein [Paenibacillus pabuli]
MNHFNQENLETTAIERTTRNRSGHGAVVRLEYHSSSPSYIIS